MPASRVAQRPAPAGRDAEGRAFGALDKPGPPADAGSGPRPAAAILLAALLAALLACSAGGEEREMAEADRAFAAGDYHQAQGLYQAYLQKRPQGRLRWEAWRRLLDVSRTVRRDGRDTALLLESMRLEFAEDPGRASQLLWELAETYTALREWDHAVAALQDLLAQGADDTEAWRVYWQLGKIHQFQGRHVQAREAMSTCLEQAPDDGSRATCMYELAQVETLLKNRSAARELLAKVLDLPGAGEETRALAAFLLADLHEAEGRPAEAVRLLETIRQTYPNPLAVETRLKHLRSGGGS